MFLGVTSVLEVGDGVFEVLSTSGDTHLGGDDFDKVGHSRFSLSYHICLFQSIEHKEICFKLGYLILYSQFFEFTRT
jgi:hypothetical protein